MDAKAMSDQICEKTLSLKNEDGLHARPAGLLAKKAGQFSSKIEILANGTSKNAKSIMSLMSLGLKFNDEIVIRAEGADAADAVKSLCNMFETGFKDLLS